MEMSDRELFDEAVKATRKVQQVARLRDDWKFMGYVGAALLTRRGNLYSGINIQLYCGMGFCAEASTVSVMIKNGETQIEKIIATTAEGSILPPCGRCREMLYQIDEANLDTEVIIAENEKKLLRDLLPYNWQHHFDRPLF